MTVAELIAALSELPDYYHVIVAATAASEIDGAEWEVQGEVETVEISQPYYGGVRVVIRGD